MQFPDECQYLSGVLKEVLTLLVRGRLLQLPVLDALTARGLRIEPIVLFALIGDFEDLLNEKANQCTLLHTLQGEGVGLLW